MQDETEMTPPQQTAERTPGADRGRRRVVIRAIAAGLAVVVLAAIAFGTARLVVRDDDELSIGLPVELVVPSGASAASIYALLDERGVANSGALQSAAQALDAEGKLQAGTYAFTTGMDPAEVIAQLVLGSNVDAPSTFTVVEGWTVARIIEELALKTSHSQADFVASLESGELTSSYLPSALANDLARWEGLIFPATYPLDPTATPGEILAPMIVEMERRLGTLDWGRIEALGVTRYEAIIVASLIEREASLDEERPIMASVIYNRLSVPMRLQIDATVIYALGYNPGVVTSEHLDTDSPYNTYRNDGLPPTPIGTTSQASLEAAVNPAFTDYLFYVLGESDGTHYFATTFEEHQANIERARENGVRE